MDNLKKEIKQRMDHAKEHLARELSGLRTGRASTALLDTISVDYYGAKTPLKQLAQVAVPESRMITITPWEQRIVPDIEKAILEANLGLTPSNDGKVIRIVMPQLTEERRKEIIKVAKKLTEEARVAMRNVRRDGMESIKKMEKDKTVSEDIAKKTHDEIQKITDDHIKQLDELLAKKEKEIMEN